jgi:DNA polymerase
MDARVSKEDLMSNDKFAKLLAAYNVSPPKKLSPTTGKETWAFAKSDEEFKRLITHQDERVQSLVAARLGNKSTLEETRTQRFIDIAKRGLLPVPVRYYAAHTGRWGGDDKINLQNLPSRGTNANMLKRGIIAPQGYSIIDADSAQIEARVLAWLAEQDDLTEAFAKGEDVYKKMASRIYGVAESDVTKDQRFVGKTTILGAGYGMGAQKFQDQLKTFGFDMELHEARRVIKIYRETNHKIIENVCQAIARCIIGEQMLQIAKRYRVVLTVHDSIACCVKDEEVDEAQEYIEECMRRPPEWAEGLPIDCESGKGKSYGECD